MHIFYILHLPFLLLEVFGSYNKLVEYIFAYFVDTAFTVIATTLILIPRKTNRWKSLNCLMFCQIPTALYFLRESLYKY